VKNERRFDLWVLGLALPVLLGGCGGGGGARPLSFGEAEKAAAPATIEGAPDTASIRRDTGKPTEFTVREDGTGQRMSVLAPADVAVPSNLSSATWVSVTGKYDASQRRFIATEVEPKVPPREKQPRG
jgi:hypothetical protein